VWAGDSRAYIQRAGRLQPITHDHTLVQQLIDAEALTEAARDTHPQAHVITRAVGAAPSVGLDRRFAALMPGDRFVLCSDGLTRCVTDEEIDTAVRGHWPERACDVLMDLALDRGAPDNVSVIVLAADRAF
jgi:protein phosphatase